MQAKPKLEGEAEKALVTEAENSAVDEAAKAAAAGQVNHLIPLAPRHRRYKFTPALIKGYACKEQAELPALD